MPRVLRAAHHDIIDLGPKPVFGGGEADLYVLPTRSDKLAKVFRKPKENGRPARVSALVNRPLRQPLNSSLGGIAAPEEVLLDPTSGEVVGYVMNRIEDAKPSLGIWNVQSSDYQPFSVRIEIGWRFSAILADLTAHRLNVILTDLNPQNVLIDGKERVWLIDLDSAQVTTPDGRTHRSPTHMREFLPPRLQGEDLKQVDRTREDELFALAVLLFKLFMEGYHPFDGRPVDKRKDKPKLEDRIRDGDWPYSPNSASFAPPIDAPPFAALPRPIQELFTRAFVLGRLNPLERPAATEWADTIGREIKDQKARYGQIVSPWPSPLGPSQALIHNLVAGAPASPQNAFFGRFLAASATRRRWLYVAGGLAVVAVVPLVLFVISKESNQQVLESDEQVFELPVVATASTPASTRDHGRPAPRLIRELETTVRLYPPPPLQTRSSESGRPVPLLVRELRDGTSPHREMWEPKPKVPSAKKRVEPPAPEVVKRPTPNVPETTPEPTVAAQLRRAFDTMARDIEKYFNP
jgi:hypothetical protein